jgi:hypothetical protein
MVTWVTRQQCRGIIDGFGIITILIAKGIAIARATTSIQLVTVLIDVHLEVLFDRIATDLTQLTAEHTKCECQPSLRWVAPDGLKLGHSSLSPPRLDRF